MIVFQLTRKGHGLLAVSEYNGEIVHQEKEQESNMKKRIGHYDIISELGRGGMGVVLKAHEAALDRHVAIKVLTEQLSNDENLCARFVREAQSAASLNHPNIIQIYFIGEEDGQRYFVMEYVEGESLSQLIHREKRLAPVRAAQILVQAASGLAAAHDKEIIHRDIKPANIMLDARGIVKLADFGIAFRPDPEQKLTATGQFLGTPGYLCPEVCLGQPMDHRSDIFSLGIVFFEMLTGATPFKSDSPLMMLRQVVESEIPDVRALNSDVDEKARDILTRMIAKKPDERFGNCHELVGELQTYLAEHERANPSTRPVIPPTVASPSTPRTNAVQPTEALPTLADTVATGPVATGNNDPTEVLSQSQLPGPQQDAASMAPTEVLSPAELPRDEPPGRRPPAQPRDEVKVEPPPQKKSPAVLIGVLALVALVVGAAVFVLLKPAAPDEMHSNASTIDTSATVVDHRGDITGGNSEMVSTDPASDTGQNVVEEHSGTRQPDEPADITQPNGTAPPQTVTAGHERSEPQTYDVETASFSEPKQNEADDRDSTVPTTSTAQPLETNMPMPEESTDARATLADDSTRTNTNAPAARKSATSAPTAIKKPKIVVVAWGDPLLSDPLEHSLEKLFENEAHQIVDEEMIPELENNDGMGIGTLSQRVREAGGNTLVVARVEEIDARELNYLGRNTTAYTARLDIRCYPLERPSSRKAERWQGKVEYTTLNAEKEAEKVSPPGFLQPLQGGPAPLIPLSPGLGWYQAERAPVRDHRHNQ